MGLRTPDESDSLPEYRNRKMYVNLTYDVKLKFIRRAIEDGHGEGPHNHVDASATLGKLVEAYAKGLIGPLLR